MRTAAALLGIASAVIAPAAQADAPPMARTAISTRCSLDGRACATIDRQRGRTSVKRADGSVWTMAAAPDSVSVSNDGSTLVEQYRGANLLEADAGPMTPMLIFHDRSKIVRRVVLRDLVGDPGKLPKSVSHRIWADMFGFDTDGSYVVDTVDGRRFRYTMGGAKVTVGRSPAR